MMRWVPFILLILAPFARASRVLVVSDIDDTIKVSDVLSTAGKITRAADTSSPFLGMAALYQLIVNENPQATKIVYLSNAPDQIFGIPAFRNQHQKFLDENKFPAGELLLREDLADQDHKIRALRLLIETEKPEVLILLGDNGERDSDIYHQVVQENPSLKTLTWIHQLYRAKALYPEQFGYVTPIEISLKLSELQLLKTESLNWTIANVAPRIVSEVKGGHFFGAMTFPEFEDCGDFKWVFSRPPALTSLISKVERECN